MNDTTQTIVRSVKGLADESQAEIIVAGILAAVAVVWGVLHRKPAP
jgi:hypothetical protein